jgi:peroxiredoxin
MATTKTTTPQDLLKVGTQAPDITLHTAPDQTASLSDFRGRPVVLVFYPADWSPVCGDQVSLYNELLDEFGEYNAQVLGISVDGAWCHVAFAKHRNLHFPLLSDFEPKGDVSKTYGAYHYDAGMSARALFVLDADGIIRWNYLSPDGVNPGADGILRALESLTAEQRGSATAGRTA